MTPLARIVHAQPCPPPSVSATGGTSASTACSAVDPEADWLARSRGAGVVWAHDFRSDAEVTNFRWSSGVGGGNDPNGVGSTAHLCRRITTDGVSGGGCLEVVRQAGTSETGSVWWRPFSPMVGTGNGRGIDDPGAGILTPQSYAATQGGSQIAHWGLPRSPRRGIYCNPQYGRQGIDPGVDGHDFYVQMRIKVDPRRKNSPAVVGGKLLYLTHTWQSYTDQEIITYSYGGGNGGGNPFRMYRGAHYLALEQAENGTGANRPQVNSEYGSCQIYDNPSGC